MEIENKLTDWAEVIKTTDLLQSGEVKIASEIPNPENLTKKDLLPMVLTAGLYCVSHRFGAVAYTQFPDQIFNCVNANKDLKNIIYFGCNDRSEPLTDLIVINPHLSFPKRNKRYISIEGCGSLEMGKIQMAIKRPGTIKLDGYFWRIGMEQPQKRMIKLSNCPASVVQHENDHLEGKDATFFPERILNMIKLPKSFLKNIELDREAWGKLLRSLSETGGYRYLINKKGKLLVVDYKGKFIKEYPVGGTQTTSPVL